MSYRNRFLKINNRMLLVGSCALICFTVTGLLSATTWTEYPLSYTLVAEKIGSSMRSSQYILSGKPLDPFDSSQYLKGEPTDSFRDNLLPDVRYVTSWISSGWTNDVMTYVCEQYYMNKNMINLIYLGILTKRVAVLPMFTPASNHMGNGLSAIHFGDIFDVPRLRTLMNHPLVEWYEVKNSSSEVLDEIGCWNVWGTVAKSEGRDRYSPVIAQLQLDVSYTKTPSWIKLQPNTLFSSFAALSALGFPEGHKKNAVDPQESRVNHVKLLPDEQMLCFDYLYYASGYQNDEFRFDYSPAWLFVGQHMHWNPRLEHIAMKNLRKAMGIEGSADTPPWITVHVRRDDFSWWCPTGVPVEDCFATLSVYARRVEEVKQELLQRKGINVQHVIMTSDEKNATWWQEVADMGWYRIDGSEVAALHGRWYPMLVDVVIQSKGIGLVGTDRSTLSLLAQRRVESWQDGVVRAVKWGKLDSDSH